MKKYLFLIIAALLASFAVTASAQGTDLTKKEIKRIEKEAKKSAKRYEKEGYKYIGPGSFESALTKIIIAIDQDDKFLECPIFIEGARSVNMGEAKATHDVLDLFLRLISPAFVKGETTLYSEVGSKDEYKVVHYKLNLSRIEEEWGKDIVKHFTIYRDSPTGNGFDVIVFFTIPNPQHEFYRQKIEKMIND